MEKFVYVFLPMFVAMDIIGGIPVFYGLTKDIEPKKRTKIFFEAALTTFIVGLMFMVIGNKILDYLGVIIADFKIGGGIVLLLLALREVIGGGNANVEYGSVSGVVPIAMPLLLGPAFLTTLLVGVKECGFYITFLAFGANVVLAIIALFLSTHLFKIFRKGGSEAMAKIAGIILVAMAIKFIREGLLSIIK